MGESQNQQPGPHDVCRICYQREFKFGLDGGQQCVLNPTISELLEPSINQHLIKPCNCRGSFAYVHQVCLANWLRVTKHKNCDICRFKFKLHYHRKSLHDWLVESKRNNGKTTVTNELYNNNDDWTEFNSISSAMQRHDNELSEILIAFNVFSFAFYLVGLGLTLSGTLIQRRLPVSHYLNQTMTTNSSVTQQLTQTTIDHSSHSDDTISLLYIIFECIYFISLAWLFVITLATWSYVKWKYNLYRIWSEKNFNILVLENENHHLSRTTMSVPRDIMRASGLRFRQRRSDEPQPKPQTLPN